jgi:GNAT superfamily N-acetyltransferase
VQRGRKCIAEADLMDYASSRRWWTWARGASRLKGREPAAEVKTVPVCRGTIRSDWILPEIAGRAAERRGYGRAAMGEVIRRLRATPGCKRIRTAFEPTNAVAEVLYESLGFRKTGEVYEVELVAVLELKEKRSDDH